MLNHTYLWKVTPSKEDYDGLLEMISLHLQLIPENCTE